MERLYNIKNSDVKILFGNILQSKTEVIVSSDDCYLSMGGGISKCISQAAGDAVRQDAQKKVPAQLGNAIVTTAGNLPQKFIFHAITIDKQYAIERFSKNSEQNHEIHQFIIKQSIKNCFKLLAAHDLHSIAFPAIGAGAAKIPYEKVAQLMAEAISEMLSMTNKCYHVEIYLYDRYQRMEPWDFLPFFESFASASHVLQHEGNNKYFTPQQDFSNINIKDNAKVNAMDHQVFVSYSRKDAEIIKPICGILNELSVKYWIDIDGIYSGENYKDVICKAIKSAQLVIFLSSANSNASHNVAKEISLADEYRKTIIPIRLDNSPYAPHIDYDLNSIDSIDYYKDEEAALDKIKKTIQGKLVMAQLVTSL